MTSTKSRLLSGVSLATLTLFLAAMPARADQVVVNGSDQAILADPGSDPAVLFQTDNTAAVAYGVDLSTNVETTNNMSGSLALGGDNTVNGNIGDSTHGLNVVAVNDLGVGAGVVTGDLYASDVVIYGDMAAHAGAPTNGSLEIRGNADVGTFWLENDGLLLFSGANKNVQGDISNDGNDGNGSVYFGGATSYAGDMGDGDNALKKVYIGADTNYMYGDIYAGEINFSSGLPDMLAPLDVVTADHTLTFSGGTNIAGNVTTDVNGDGTLVFNGSISVDGDIGSSEVRLGTLRAGHASTLVPSAMAPASLIEDGVVQINGDVYVDNIEIDNDYVEGTDNAILAFFENVYTDNIRFLHDGLAYFEQSGGWTSYMSGNFITDNDGEGNILIQTPFYLEGNVGAADKKLSNVSLYDDGIFVGDMYANTVELKTNGDGDSDHEVYFFGNLDAALTTENDGQGIICFYNDGEHKQLGTDEAALSYVNYRGESDGLASIVTGPEATHTMGGDVYADMVRLYSDGELALGSSNRLISGDFMQSGTLSLGGHVLTVGGAMGGSDTVGVRSLGVSGIVEDNRIINTSITGSGATDLGRIVTGGDIYMDGVTVNVTLGSGVNPDDVSYQFLTSTDGSIYNLDEALIQGGAVWTWSLDLNDEENIAYITGTRSGGYVDHANGLQNPGTGAGRTLDDLHGDGGGSGMGDLFGALDGLDGDDLGGALNDLAPSNNDAVPNAVGSAVNAATGRISQRLGGGFNGADRINFSVPSERPGAVNMSMAEGGGISAGDMATNRNSWVAVSADHARQGMRDAQTGFEVGSYGLAMGVDKQLANDDVIGGALAIGDADVRHKDSRIGDQTKVRSYQAYAYGSTRKNGWKLDGIAGLGLHRIENSRGTITGTARGDYDAVQATLRLNAGYDMPVKKGFMFTPLVSVDYTHLAEDGYTETGAGGANLVVDDNDVNSFTTGIGARLGWEYKPRVGMQMLPEIHAVVSHDWMGERMESTSRFAGGGASFTTQGAEPDRTSLNLGGSMVMKVNDETDVTVSYDAELKDKYVDQSGMVKARFRF